MGIGFWGIILLLVLVVLAMFAVVWGVVLILIKTAELLFGKGGENNGYGKSKGDF
jgi:hypothetical protein